MPTMMRDATISFPLLGDWSIDPSASFTLFGRTFYWYGVIIAVGFILAMLYCARHCRRCGIGPDTLYDFLIWMIPIAIIGARLYYVIFQWGDYRAHPIDALKIWEGGLAIGPVFALGRTAARAFALGASALHRAAVRAFASSTFVPSAFAGLHNARVVRRHILVGHTAIRGSRRVAVGSPRRPSHRARRGQNRRERDRQKRDPPPPHERSFGRGRGTREATTSTIRANSVMNSKRPAHIWKM